MRWVEQAYGTSAETFTSAFDDRDGVLAGLAAIGAAVRAGDARAAAAAVERYAEDSARRMLDALEVGAGEPSAHGTSRSG